MTSHARIGRRLGKQNSVYAFVISSIHVACPTHLILLDLIFMVMRVKKECANYTSPYASSSSVLSRHPLQVLVCLSAPSYTLSICVLPLMWDKKFGVRAKGQENCSSVRFNLCVFRLILNCMVASSNNSDALLLLKCLPTEVMQIIRQIRNDEVGRKCSAHGQWRWEMYTALTKHEISGSYGEDYEAGCCAI